MSGIIPFIVVAQFFLAPFVEKTAFAPFYFFCFFVTD